MLAAAAAFAAEEPKERLSELFTRGAGQAEATRVGDGIFGVSGTGNAYRVLTSEGSVVVDTGLGIEAKRHHELLLAVGDAPVRALVLTHAHADHIGGAALWLGPGVEVITSRAFVARNRDQLRLDPFRSRRARVLWAAVMDERAVAQAPPYPEVAPDRLVDDRYRFTLGGVAFEVLATPGGEGPDGLSLWLPERRALFTGDLLGPTTASFPNLFTLRGENLREALPIVESLDRLLALDPPPDLLLPGHFEPVVGAEKIRALLTRTRDAIRYVHDATVAGMNEGKDLWTLMREVKLPPELAVSEQYGRVPWGVRAIWESYTGWFRYESTSELYAVPPTAVAKDLAALAGGAGAIGARARTKVEQGRPEEALPLLDVALAAEPGNRVALEAKLAALEALLGRDGENFQLGGWLRHEIGLTHEALAGR